MKTLELLVSDEFFDSLVRAIGSSVSLSECQMDHIRHDKLANANKIHADAIFKTWFVYPQTITPIRNIIEECDSTYAKKK